jgi:3'-phosphoadenosine 5'-phosphosulfate sulfotransferase (PAPS reductase)/FAD synthetase
MEYLKSLIAQGYSLEAIPSDLKKAVDMVFSANPVNSQIASLDWTTFCAIREISPADPRVENIFNTAQLVIGKDLNNGFNTIIEEQPKAPFLYANTILEKQEQSSELVDKFDKGGIAGLKAMLPFVSKEEMELIKAEISRLESIGIDTDIPSTMTGNNSQFEVFTEVMQVDLTPQNVADHLTSDRQKQKEPQLTLLSFGGGQDSWAMLYKLIFDAKFRKTYAPKDLVVVMSDTGNEHPYTYKGVTEAEALCKKHNIDFKFLKNDMGYHTDGWMSLKANLIRNKVILSATMGSKPCTSALKINPLDKYLREYMCQKYGFENLSAPTSWKDYEDKFGTKVRVMIGFAKDEEMRAIKSLKVMNTLPKYKQRHFQYVFPLIEEGWNRQSAQDIITQYHPYLIPPSNCMICFYQSDQELIWLERNHPEEFYEWVEMEKAKLDRFADVPDIKNNGVYGAVNLIQKLQMAKDKKDANGVRLGDYTDEQLWEYKMSHGHCVKSSF